MIKRKIDVVGAVIYNPSEKLYLVTMRGKDKHMGGLWEFPGGKIEEGEAPEKALVREIQEELGCIIGVQSQLVDYTHEYDEIIVRLITFECSIIEGVPQLTEHEEIRWVSVEELEKLTFAEADIPTVNLIIKDKGN